MKRTVGVGIVAILGFFLVTPDCSLSEETVIVPADVLAALQQEHAGYRGFREGALSVEDVPADRIPRAVADSVLAWVHKVMQPGWLPGSAGRLMQGEIREMDYVPPQKVDFVALNYRRGGSCFSISEGQGVLNILWHNPNIQTAGDPAKTVVLLAQCLLRIPEADVQTLYAQLRERPCAAGPLFVGKLTVPVEALPTGVAKDTPGRYPYWQRQWYHAINVWIAPGYFYVSFPELTGVPPEELALTAKVGGYRPRFLPQGAAPRH